MNHKNRLDRLEQQHKPAVLPAISTPPEMFDRALVTLAAALEEMARLNPKLFGASKHDQS